MKRRIKAIPTSYKNIQFRSKLEASWARFFDSINMEWFYEVEGYTFADGTYYLPDFWLPSCKTFFEVKGPLGDKDMSKMKQLAEAVAPKGIMVAIGSVAIPDSLGLVFPVPFEWADSWDIERGFKEGQQLISDRDYVDIAICHKCKKPYIIWKSQGWTCRNCGYYDGDNTWDTLIL